MENAYPKAKYSKDAYRVVQNAEEEKKLGSGWADSPGAVSGVKTDDNGYAAAATFHDTTPLTDAPVRGPLGEGHTYHDRIVWQAQNKGIRIDKRWSDETLLRKIAELQPLSREGIEEANKAVPLDQELDYDPTITPKEREMQDKVDAKVKEQTGVDQKAKDEKAKADKAKAAEKARDVD